MMYVWLLVGFVLLIKGADFFVEGSSSVAKLLRVPSIIIGLTIVAFGTSAPELAVSVSAALSGSNDIAVGNVIGSNIFNLLVVVGICGAIMPMAINRKILYGDFLLSIVVAVVMGLLFAFDHRLSRLDGCILLLLFAGFLYKMVRDTLKGRAEMEEENSQSHVIHQKCDLYFGRSGSRCDRRRHGCGFCQSGGCIVWSQ